MFKILYCPKCGNCLCNTFCNKCGQDVRLMNVNYIKEALGAMAEMIEKEVESGKSEMQCGEDEVQDET